jgi:hypothetical protein
VQKFNSTAYFHVQKPQYRISINPSTPNGACTASQGVRFRFSYNAARASPNYGNFCADLYFLFFATSNHGEHGSVQQIKLCSLNFSIMQIALGSYGTRGLMNCLEN